ncbi:MAG: VWA domain-containing protein [Myxococcales bacterium]|nr:VWA domain-containing protein [Myxococcales bacterium]
MRDLWRGGPGRRRRRGPAVMVRVLALALLAAACSRADLEAIPAPPPPPRDDRLAVSGELCTLPPDRRDFPLRVLFVVDASESMEVTDPPDPATGLTGREAAVAATWGRLLDQSPDQVKVGIIRFSAQAASRTPVDADADGLPESYFSANRDQLATATAALRFTDRTTNYRNALDEAYLELRTELLRAEDESSPRTRYAVIFVSDGLPDETGGEAGRNTADDIVAGVQALADLAALFDVGDFSFHTVYLSNPEGVLLDQPAQALLTRMAEAGGGTYRSVPQGETLDFLHIDLTSLQRLYRLRSLVALNLNQATSAGQIPATPVPALDDGAFKDLDLDGEPSCGDLLIDSDGDGLADLVEQRIGTDPLATDTDGDGVGDRLEWRARTSGLDPLDPTDTGCFVPDRAEPGACEDADADGFCDCPDVDADGRCDYPDTDGDGLTDCEEIFLGSSQVLADSDADGVPDLVELRLGTSPVDDDGPRDLDWDGTPNGVELRTGGDPLCDDAASRSESALDVTLEEAGTAGASLCYRFRVARLTLLPTRANAGADAPGNGLNRVLLFAGEAAFDDPGAFAAWRVACVEARYLLDGDRKDPPSGRMALVDEDFVPLARFDPRLHCRRP